MTITPTGLQSAKRHGVHITSLDGVRGIAILLVLMVHLVTEEQHSAGPFLHAMLQITKFGWMGVDIFFVLSGFLITGILLDSLQSPHYFRNFYARRTLRIFPLYYMVVLVFVLLSPVLTGASGLDEVRHDQMWYWTYMSNVPSIWRGGFMPGFLHFWSLAVEEQFYLVWPLALFLCGPKHIIKVCIGCILIAPLLRIGLTLAGGASFTNAIYVLTPCRFDSLAFGGLGAALLRHWPEKKLKQAVKWTAFIGAACWLSVLLGARGASYSRPLWQTAGYTVDAALSASLVVFLAMEQTPTVMGNIFRNKILRFLGKYSYGIYVFHIPIQALLRRYISPVLAAHFSSSLLNSGLILFLEVTVTIATAFASWHLYERHFLRLKKYFEVAKKPGAAALPVNQ